jgi:hypothetical protein
MSEPTILNGPDDPHGDGLDPLAFAVVAGGGFRIGFVEEIHGEGGRPCPEYVPTRHELMILFRHWAEVQLRIEAEWAVTAQVGSDEIRRQPYAIRRWCAIRKLIGEDKADEAHAEIKRRLRKEYGFSPDGE